MKKPVILNSIAMLFAIAFTFTAEVNAQQSYEFIFGQSNYDVTVGTTVDVDVFLRETVSGGSIARLADGGDDGLFGFAFNADFGTSTGGMGSTIVSSTDVLLNTIFDDTDFNNATIIGSSVDVIGQTTNTTSGIEVSPVSTGVFEVQLATLTVTAGDEGSVTTFTLADHLNNGDTVFADLFTADPSLAFGSTSITVVAIPEPASATILLGLFGAGFIRRRKR